MHLRSFFFAISLTFIVNSLFAQSPSFTGSWRLNIDMAIEIMDPSFKTQYDTLSATIKQKAKSRMDGREFNFLDDGNITVNWTSHKGQQVSKGKWIKNETQSILTVTIDNTTSEYDYEFVSADVLILRSKRKGGFFDNLYLVKVN